MGWTTGVRFPAGAMNGYSSLGHRVQSRSGAHRAYSPMDTGGSFLGDKAAGADLSPPSCAEIKNAWNCTSTSLICLRGLVLS
jgi:hypothetical protein